MYRSVLYHGTDWRELTLPGKHSASRISPLLFHTTGHRGHRSPTHLPVNCFPVGHNWVFILLTMVNILQGYGYASHYCSSGTKIELGRELASKTFWMDKWSTVNIKLTVNWLEEPGVTANEGRTGNYGSMLTLNLRLALLWPLTWYCWTFWIKLILHIRENPSASRTGNDKGERTRHVAFSWCINSFQSQYHGLKTLLRSSLKSLVGEHQI